MQRELSYELVEGDYKNIDEIEYNSYGLKVKKGEVEIAEYPDLSLNEKIVRRFIKFLSGKEYSQDIMDCIIEDIVTFKAN